MATIIIEPDSLSVMTISFCCAVYFSSATPPNESQRNVFDRLVGAGEQHRRHLNAESLGGLQVVTTVSPAKLLQALHKCRHAPLRLRIVSGDRIQYVDATHPRLLLRPHHERPRRRDAEKRDELAPLHYSITSSARA
jgi:hypothetical protein